MASTTLSSLWKLHEVDSAIVHIRSQAAALDPGRQLMAQIEDAKKRLQAKADELSALRGELEDLELQQKGLEDKIKKFDKQLYGGSLVNPREVENINKEIALLKQHRAALDERILELWEQIPPVKREVEGLESAVAELQRALSEHQRGVLQRKSQLEAAYKSKSSERPIAAQSVEPNLLHRYDAIRQKHGGIAMSRILKDGSCEMCGTLQPRKTVEAAKADELVLCEGCHRILMLFGDQP